MRWRFVLSDFLKKRSKARHTTTRSATLTNPGYFVRCLTSLEIQRYKSQMPNSQERIDCDLKAKYHFLVIDQYSVPPLQTTTFKRITN